MAVNVTIGADTENFEKSLDRAQSAVQNFSAEVVKLQGPFEQLTISCGTAGDAIDQYQASSDVAAASTKANAAAVAKLGDANDNVAGGFRDIVKSAHEVSGGIVETTENILNTINHLKLLALAAYAMSPAFRAIINSGAGTALGVIRSQTGMLAPTLETIGKTALPAVANGLAFFSRIAGPIAVVVAAWEGFNAVIHKGAELLDQYSGAERKLFGSDVDSELKDLTAFQHLPDMLDPAVGARATQLATKLDEAKRNISDFLKVQIDLTGPALQLDSIWVGIVGVIGDAAKKGSDLAKSMQDLGSSSFWTQYNNFINNSGLNFRLPGTLIPDDALGKTDKLTTATDLLRAGYERLKIAMGGGFVGRFTQDIDALAGKEKEEAAATPTQTSTADQAHAAIVAMQGAIQEAERFYKTDEQMLAFDLSMHRISEQQKTDLTIAAINQRMTTELDAEHRALDALTANDAATLAEKQRVENQITKTLQEAAAARTAVVQKETQGYLTQWQSALGSIESAFNSQLRGLLAGTTTWSQAFKNILGDLIIDFIKMCETMVVKWAAAQLAQTTAATTGAAARTAADLTSADAGIVSMAANAVKAILVDAGQAFAGVFAFLAPVMGPAAAGPAAAAQATVSAAAIFDVGTNYVTRGGLAIIHPGEAIIPPAQGSGPYRGPAAGGANISAPVNISVTALDSQSVARFFNDNSKHMLRAINDAVKRGAHLGLSQHRF